MKPETGNRKPERALPKFRFQVSRFSFFHGCCILWTGGYYCRPNFMKPTAFFLSVMCAVLTALGQGSATAQTPGDAAKAKVEQPPAAAVQPRTAPAAGEDMMRIPSAGAPAPEGGDAEPVYLWKLVKSGGLTMIPEAFEEFYFRVCTLDYAKMQPGMKALAEAMMATDLVEIKGPGTDLRFSIKGISAIPCGGEHNIPDGEVFTAPVKTSVQGVISYNAPTVYQGTAFDNVRLEFKDGKIVKATANNTEKLNAIFDSDPGARYVGEFAIGFNPLILQPMRDILFDEKIAGSFHFTPGQCYDEAGNGNQSQVHWDLVCIQRPDYGGGEIRFDGQLIRKDGLFVPKPLQALNPERLLR